MNIVPRVSTPQTLESIASALRAAYAAEFGKVIDRTTAELLTAQILIETANGQGVKNNSPGNITASSKWAGDAWRPPWFEPPTETTSARNRDLHAKMKAGNAPSAFRAFATWDEGMRDYVRTLARQFPTIVAARSPRQLAEAIFNSGYTRDHTPDESTPTLAALVERVRKSGVFDDLTTPAPAPVSPVDTPIPEPTTHPDSPRPKAVQARTSQVSAPQSSSRTSWFSRVLTLLARWLRGFGGSRE